MEIKKESDRNMNKKIISTWICMLMVLTTFVSVAGTMNSNENSGERQGITDAGAPLNSRNVVYAADQSIGKYIREMPLDVWSVKISKDRCLDDGSVIKVPLENTVIRAGDVIEIRGNASDPNFQNYTLEWGIGNQPTEWFTNGTTLVNGGLVEVINNTLGTWNTSSITIVGEYTIRLTVNYDGSQKRDTVVVYLDPTLQEGWPQFYPNVADVVGGDIDNDGKLEIVAIVEHQHNGMVGIAVWEHNGSMKEGFPVHLTNIGSGYIPPALGDVDNDGELEIVTGYGFNAYKIYVVNNDGTILDGWPQDVHEGTGVSKALGLAVLADIDDDGYLEIFAGGDRLNAWHYNGTCVTGFPKNFASLSPAICDLDADGELEIIILKPNVNKLLVFDASGNELLNVTLEAYATKRAPPVVGDINHDGSREIVFSLGNGKVYAYSIKGEIVQTWSLDSSSEVANPPVLADIDGDGDLEIFLSSYKWLNYGKVYGWDHEGNRLPGWPIRLLEFPRVAGSPVIGNVDEDDDVEIVLGGECTEGYELIYAWDTNGSVVDGWPKSLTPVWGYGIMSSAMIVDIDGDGDSEVAVSSNSYIYSSNGVRPPTGVYVWDLPGDYNSEWPMFQYNAQHTGLYPAKELIANAGGPYEGFENDPVQFNGYAFGGSLPYVWSWDFGDGNTSDIQNPVHAYDSADTYTITLTVTDNGSNSSVATTTATIVSEDDQPPVTTHTFDGNIGENGWYAGDVYVTITAEDDSSGVEFTYYKVDGGDWQEYDAAFLVTEDGMHTLSYYSIDYVGNIESVKGPFGFKIDQTKPEIINLTAENIGFRKWLFIAIVNDATSGINKVVFRVDSETLGNVTEEPYEWEYSGTGHYVRIIVYDNAGNNAISDEVKDQAVPGSQSQSSSSTLVSVSKDIIQGQSISSTLQRLFNLR